jgi:hypothetical protein
MRVEPVAAGGMDHHGKTNISVAALLQVGLQQEALHFPALVGLRPCNGVERQSKGAGRGQPSLEESELDGGGGRTGRRGSCGVHIADGIIADSIMSRARVHRPEQNALLARHVRRFQELKRDLDQLQYFCKGSVLKRRTKCGKAYCACASDPTKRHGPYFELTYKVDGKTINLRLSPEAAPFYQAASAQYRKLKALLHRLEKVSQSILKLQAKLAQPK